MDMKTKTYTMEEFLSIQRALRKTLAMPQEDFSVQDLLRMLSDEVRALHMNGYDDEGVARLSLILHKHPHCMHTFYSDIVLLNLPTVSE